MVTNLAEPQVHMFTVEKGPFDESAHSRPLHTLPIYVPSRLQRAPMSEAGPSNRFTTPPPRPLGELELTPEQVKRIEINRLKGQPSLPTC